MTCNKLRHIFTKTLQYLGVIEGEEGDLGGWQFIGWQFVTMTIIILLARIFGLNGVFGWLLLLLLFALTGHLIITVVFVLTAAPLYLIHAIITRQEGDYLFSAILFTVVDIIIIYNVVTHYLAGSGA